MYQLFHDWCAEHMRDPAKLSALVKSRDSKIGRKPLKMDTGGDEEGGSNDFSTGKGEIENFPYFSDQAFLEDKIYPIMVEGGKVYFV